MSNYNRQALHFKDIVRKEIDDLYYDLKDFSENNNSILIDGLKSIENNNKEFFQKLNENLIFEKNNISSDKLDQNIISNNDETLKKKDTSNTIVDSENKIINTVLNEIIPIKKDIENLNKVRIDSFKLNDEQTNILKRLNKNNSNIIESLLKLDRLNKIIIDKLNEKESFNNLLESKLSKIINDNLPNIIEQSIKPIFTEIVNSQLPIIIEPILNLMQDYLENHRKQSYIMKFVSVSDEEDLDDNNLISSKLKSVNNLDNINLTSSKVNLVDNLDDINNSVTNTTNNNLKSSKLKSVNSLDNINLEDNLDDINNSVTNTTNNNLKSSKLKSVNSLDNINLVDNLDDINNSVTNTTNNNLKSSKLKSVNSLDNINLVDNLDDINNSVTNTTNNNLKSSKLKSVNNLDNINLTSSKVNLVDNLGDINNSVIYAPNDNPLQNPILNELQSSKIGEKRKYYNNNYNYNNSLYKKYKSDNDDFASSSTFVIDFINNLGENEQIQHYWDHPKIINSKWCRYCLTSLKIYHDEDQCDYNIILRERKKRKNNLCKKCGQTKAAYHQEGTDLCKKRQLIFSKLYEKFPHSVIQLGFCPKKNIFLTTYSKINFLNLTKEQRNRYIKK
jgi:hypothetical protein